MNGERYFEENPWKRACDLIQKRGEKAEQVIAQCVCIRGSLEQTLSQWKERVTALAGKEKDGNLMRGMNVLSYIGTFGENTIVRFFLDEAAEDVCENFEIVTDRSLIVWKPINTNQGHMLSKTGSVIECSQRYVEELADGQACVFRRQ